MTPTLWVPHNSLMEALMLVLLCSNTPQIKCEVYRTIEQESVELCWEIASQVEVGVVTRKAHGLFAMVRCVPKEGER